MWLAVSGFMVMGLVSGLSLTNLSDSESFLVVRMMVGRFMITRVNAPAI